MIITPYQQLAQIPDIQCRIDAVAADLAKAEPCFAQIEPMELAELLNVCFEDYGDWATNWFSYKFHLEDAGYTYPFAEHIEYLKGYVPPKRFAVLQSLADKLFEDETGTQDDDLLGLTAEEVALIETTYTTQHATDAFCAVAQTCIIATDGTELFFEVCIGDGGELYDHCGPYQFAAGTTFDASDYIEIY